MGFVRRNGRWLLAWIAIALAGGAWLVNARVERLREDFETDARIVHRLLSQRAVQHDAVLGMLALLQPTADASRPEQRLPSVYPQILSIERRDTGESWTDPDRAGADAASRAARRPALARVDFSEGRYCLVLGAHPASYAVQFDVRAMVPWNQWPMVADASPVRVSLDHADKRFVLQQGRDGGFRRFAFRKRLAADSQPFDVVAERGVYASELPWLAMLAWAAAVAGALAALRAIRLQRIARERAEALLRLDRVGRLNALGELAGGLAHELNQPLTALLANTRAASRLLDDDPPDLATARDAMTKAAEQAKRASDVVARVRGALDKPERGAALARTELESAVRRVLYLLEPEIEARGVTPNVEASAPGIAVHADPVALEQIVHNLLTNALHALEQVPPSERALDVRISTAEGQGVLTVRDSGPGIAGSALGRIFEPFFTTRESGLGLGLSLSESLALAMNGRLSAANREPRGAELALALPLA
ncbi:MAG TPA: ATP-binding protein [Burkholderiales bacterium]|nr:ATP-binding protein [Burkholderiales bacterium]